MKGQWELGEMVITFVGAFNVGSISLHFDKKLKTNARRFTIKHDNPEIMAEFNSEKWDKAKKLRSPFESFPKNQDESLWKNYEKNKEKEPAAIELEKAWNANKGITEETKSETSKGIYVKKGAEMGMFNFGSTIVMIFTAPKGCTFNLKEGDKVKVGQAIFSSAK